MNFPRLGYLAKEDGNVTVLSLFLTCCFLMLGGYAVDVSSLATETTRLQIAVDSAAHAALLERELGTITDAQSRAVELARMNLPPEQYGEVLTNAALVFGDWNSDTNTFTADPDSKNAIRATAYRTEANENALKTFIWQVVGVNSLNIVAQSTYTTYDPSCFREGFVAEGVVDIQSNNGFANGFCIHSNSYVSLNSNNYFEPGTVVSMPDLADIDLPNSGFQTNTGLEAAQREGSYNIRIVKRIEDIVATIDEVDSPYRPSFLTTTNTYTLTDNRIDETDLTEGALHYWTCGGGSGTLQNVASPIKNVVIVTDCEVRFGSGTVLQNVIMVNSNDSPRSFGGPSAVQLGLDDNCADGGGVQLVTVGGINFAANLSMFGSQLLALGAIEFAARADGFEGASMVSATTISGTSNMNMAFCGTGMDGNFTAKYFRMVQ